MSNATGTPSTSACNADTRCCFAPTRIRDAAVFNKKVRYLCGLFGHNVHVVCDRNGYREFACHCGHTFLKADLDVMYITHPAVCVVSGHRIHYVASRGGFMEYVCRDCGHPFCFAEAATAKAGH